MKIQPRFGLITKMQRCDNSLRRHRDSAHLQHVLHLCHVGFQPVPLSSGVTKQGSEINHMEVSEDVNELGKCPLPCLITGYHLVNQHNYGKSPFFIGKPTISKRPCSSSQTVKLPEGIPIYSHDFPIKPYKTTKNSKLFNYQAG